MIPRYSPEEDRRYHIKPSERPKVLALKAQGMSVAEIARRYHVVRQTIYFVLEPSKRPKRKNTHKTPAATQVRYMRRKRERFPEEVREYFRQKKYGSPTAGD